MTEPSWSRADLGLAIGLVIYGGLIWQRWRGEE